jgi:hypothetical protein
VRPFGEYELDLRRHCAVHDRAGGKLVWRTRVHAVAIVCIETPGHVAGDRVGVSQPGVAIDQDWYL